MSTWTELQAQFQGLTDEQKGPWLTSMLTDSLREISVHREGRNILFYASAFLQKPTSMGTSIDFEDINGLMASLYGMDWDKGITLVLHTPGGVAAATESIVDYLRSKFTDLEVVVPTFAMSAGTMISLACDRIWMARHSQLGPIDPQMPMPNGMQVSARSIVDTFDRAAADIAKDPTSGSLWYPILQTLGPSLVTTAQAALENSETIVGGWLSRWMLSNAPDPVEAGRKVAKHFNDAGQHSHARRISRDEVRAQGLTVYDIEDDQSFQEAVLTAYHVVTILLTATPAVRVMSTNHGQIWLKNMVTQ